MRGKRGQAAFEYLTAYSWAFIVILIAAGGLAYFGYLDIDNFVPERCWFGTQLICEDYELDRTLPDQSTLRWKVRNNMVKPIEITNIISQDSRYPFAPSNPCNIPIEVGVGDVIGLECVVNANLSVGDRYSLPMTVTIRRNDSSIAPQHNITGEIFIVAR